MTSLKVAYFQVSITTPNFRALH